MRFLVALIFIRVHSPLLFCHFSTTIFHMRCPVADHYFLSLFTQNVQIRVTLSLLNCDLFMLSVQILVTLSLLNCDLFTLSVQILVTLSLLNCNLFMLSVQILLMAPKIVCGTMTGFTTVNIYCLGSGFLEYFLFLYIYIVCVDRSGSLSDGAFNQLRLVTLNIVLTILY